MIDILKKIPFRPLFMRAVSGFQVLQIIKNTEFRIRAKNRTKRHLKLTKQQIQRTYLKIYQKKQQEPNSENTSNLIQKAGFDLGLELFRCILLHIHETTSLDKKKNK